MQPPGARGRRRASRCSSKHRRLAPATETFDALIHNQLTIGFSVAISRPSPLSRATVARKRKAVPGVAQPVKPVPPLQTRRPAGRPAGCHGNPRNRPDWLDRNPVADRTRPLDPIPHGLYLDMLKDSFHT